MDKHRLIRSKTIIYKLGRESSAGSKTVESLTLNLFSSDFRESNVKQNKTPLSSPVVCPGSSHNELIHGVLGNYHNSCSGLSLESRRTFIITKLKAKVPEANCLESNSKYKTTGQPGRDQHCPDTEAV